MVSSEAAETIGRMSTFSLIDEWSKQLRENKNKTATYKNRRGDPPQTTINETRRDPHHAVANFPNGIQALAVFAACAQERKREIIHDRLTPFFSNSQRPTRFGTTFPSFSKNFPAHFLSREVTSLGRSPLGVLAPTPSASSRKSCRLR